MIKTLSNLLADENFESLVTHSAQQIAALISEANKQGKVICIFGNGGSAADSQHWAAELVCTYRSKERAPIPALALTTDSSVLTAWSNDFDYSNVFARQVEAFAKQIGVSIGLSTSGQSSNVLAALNLSNSLGHNTILISGDHSPSHNFIQHHVQLPSSSTPIVQTMTQVLYHYVCDFLE